MWIGRSRNLESQLIFLAMSKCRKLTFLAIPTWPLRNKLAQFRQMEQRKLMVIFATNTKPAF